MRQSRIQTIQENCMRDINKTTLRVVHRKVGESVTLRLRLFLLKHKQISIKRTRFLHGPFAIVHLPWCFIKLYECSSFTHGFINCLFKVKKSDGRIEGQICSGNYVKLEVHIERPQKQWQMGRQFETTLSFRTFPRKFYHLQYHYDLNSGEGDLIQSF